MLCPHCPQEKMEKQQKKQNKKYMFIGNRCGHVDTWDSKEQPGQRGHIGQGGQNHSKNDNQGGGNDLQRKGAIKASGRVY